MIVSGLVWAGVSVGIQHQDEGSIRYNIPTNLYFPYCETLAAMKV